MSLDTSISSNKSNIIKKRKFVIEDVIAKDPLKIEPVLASFTNGCPVQNGNLTASLYHHEGKQYKRRRNRRMLVVDGDKFKYVGKNFHEDSVSLELKDDYFLGVLDEETGKMKLVEMSSISTKPFFPGYLSSISSNDKDMDYLEKQERITEGFGGKKSKEALRRYKQFKVDTEEMKDAMDRAVYTADVKTEELDTSDSSSSFLSFLPKCNRKALQSKDIYNVKHLISNMTFDYLSEVAAPALEQDNTEIRLPLFKLLIASAKLELDYNEQLTFACIAYYVHYLVMFIKLPRLKLSQEEYPLDDCPKEIQNVILKNFARGIKRNRTKPKHLEDKALCYVFILTLIANRYEVSKQDILYSVKIEDMKLNVLMNYIGATSTKDGKLFKLITPVPPIEKRVMKKMKK